MSKSVTITDPDLKERARTAAKITFTLGKSWMIGSDVTLYVGAELEVHSTGEVEWTADIESTDSGDEADIFLYTYDKLNSELCKIHAHFDIKDAKVKKKWTFKSAPDAKVAQFFKSIDRAAFIISA